MKLIQATSSRSDGNMSFRYGAPDAVLRNRKIFLSQLRLSFDDCISLSLQHGVECIPAAAAEAGRGMRNPDGIPADCLITDQPNLFLFLYTADCLPICIHDTNQRIVAVAHLARHNTGQHFMAQIIATIQHSYSIKPADLIINIGPGIHKQSYVLPATFTQTFDPAWQPFLESTPDGTRIDLIGLVLHDLHTAGIQPTHIHTSSIDTATASDYFSHYRSVRTGEPEGRFATVIGFIN